MNHIFNKALDYPEHICFLHLAPDESEWNPPTTWHPFLRIKQTCRHGHTLTIRTARAALGLSFLNSEQLDAAFKRYQAERRQRPWEFELKQLEKDSLEQSLLVAII